MRVLHIMPDGSPGGGPTVVWTLCENLASRGVESLIMTQTGSHLFLQARAAGVTVFGLDFSSRANMMTLRSELAALFKQERPDIVHAHGARGALPVALLSRDRRPPFVYTVHGFHFPKKRLLPRVLGRLAERVCIARADCTIFVANADRVYAGRSHLLGRARHELIYNGVAVPSQLGRPQTERTYDIAYVGRLHPQKDPLILPAILLALRPERPSMLIVAGGELETKLRAAIDLAGVGDQVTLMPSMPRREALAMLAQARVFLLPSLWEGLPISLAEAMLLHVAVVASAIPGNSEIVTDGETGLLAPPTNAVAFAACIRRLLDAPAKRCEMADRGAAHAARLFSVHRQADAHHEIFRSLVKTCSRSKRPGTDQSKTTPLLKG